VQTPSWLAPPAFAQASHRPSQAPLQQTPWAQNPEAQSVGAAHACPSFAWQAPVASQVVSPVQLSASSADSTGAHRPMLPGTLHASHVPH
jgi:hypothetical protein